MTQLANRIGWTLFGVVIGVLMTSSLGTSSLWARTPQQRHAVERRWSVTVAPIETPDHGVMWNSLLFIKDAKSGGCWLAYSKGTDGISSMVAAPAAACE